MSASPKYTHARLDPEQERQLRLERKRRAELESAARKAAEERRRRERLENERSALRQRVVEIEHQIHVLLESELSRFVAAGSSELREEVARVVSELAAATNDGTLHRIDRRTRSLDRALRDLQASAFKDNHKAAGDQLAALRASLRESDQRLSSKFDAEGFTKIETALQTAERVYQSHVPDVEEVKRSLDAAAQCLASHNERVAHEYDRWMECRHRSETKLNSLGDRIEGLAVDAVVRHWKARDVEEVITKLQLSRRAFQQEQFDIVEAMASQLEKSVEEIISVSQELQLTEERRQKIVAAMRETLIDLGFMINREGLQDPQDAASNHVMVGTRMTGEPIHVSVPQGGEIRYWLPEHPISSVSNDGGQIVGTQCPEAEAVIDQVHKMLHDTFGVETDGIHWQDKPDDIDVLKARRSKPESQDRNQQRGAT